MKRVFHCIQMIEITPELIKTVQGWKVLIAVSEVVLAKLSGGISLGLEGGSDGRSGIWIAPLCPSLPNRRESGADRKLTRHKVSAACRATGFRVIIGEPYAFGGKLIEVRLTSTSGLGCMRQYWTNQYHLP